MSKTIKAQIDTNLFPDNFTFYTIPFHPIDLVKGYQTRKLLKSLENEINPDCVFTVFGPSWWTPKSSHLMGYALAHYLYKESPLYQIISLKKKLKIKMYSILHKFYFKRNGKFYVCETEDVSNRLSSFLNCDKNQIFTVTNTCNDFFNKFNPNEKNILPKKQANEFRFVTMSSFVPHKNISVLNSVIPILKKKTKQDIKFILTIDEVLFKTHFTTEAQDSIINLGRVPVSDCPQVYYECDALFLPTLMECFSANYPEAMKMGKPILTSNLSFATNICKDAALFFNPLNPIDISEKMISLISDKNLQSILIENGNQRLKEFDSAETRAKKYLEICESIC